MKKALGAFCALLLISGVLLTSTLATSAPAHASSVHPDLTICKTSPTPVGWFVNGTTWSSSCSGASPNAYTITSYYDATIGTLLTICTNAPLPSDSRIAAEWSLYSGYLIANTTCPGSIVTYAIRQTVGVPTINPGGVVIDQPQNAQTGTGAIISIYGFDFYAPDTVVVMASGFVNQYISGGSWWFDNNPAYAQINATLPVYPSGTLVSIAVYNSLHPGAVTQAMPIYIS
jgi:hypothetical protein